MTETTTLGPGTARQGEDRAPSRRVNITVWVMQVVVATVFFLAGLSKMIFHLEIYDEIGWGTWFQYLTGVLEMVGAIALLIPRLSGIAALAFVGLAVCAVNFHIFVLESSLIPIALLGVCAAIIAYVRRHSTARLLGSVFGRP